MIGSRLILITLLIKLGVAAAVSSALVRSTVFKNLLLAARRNAGQALALVAFICVPLALGVWVRVSVPNFLAADISFEAVIIVALLLGPGAAIAGGAFLSLPAVLHGEYLTLPFNIAVALIFGIYREFVSEEDIWSFSPFVDLSVYRWISRNLKRPRIDPQIVLLMLIFGTQAGRNWIAAAHPRRLFALQSHYWPVVLAIFVCPPIIVGIPLKIWNAIRIERQLEEQGRLLLEARLDALQRQINPHFLFNTLNSIASLVRFRPEQARDLIVKLASILRVLLQDREDLMMLRDELQFAAPGEAVLIHLSNFRPVKRIQDVVQIFARVARQMPARLLMVGDGPERSSAEWLAKHLKIHDRVHFLGKHDHVNQLLPAADLMLMPSEMESFGLAALEAMACEVPTIGTNVGGVPELIQNGVTGLLFSVGEVDEMSAAAVALLTDRGRLRKMAKAARAEAQRTYCASHVIPKYE